jgi:hypothetical protein
MTSYVVTWTIDVEADTPQEAAQLARDYQRPGTTAVVFDVTDQSGETTSVDLWED